MLVIVGGAPGSGKTTLARRLAAELRLPLVAKDDVKEALYETVGAPTLDASRVLGNASYRIMYLMAERLLEAGVGLVLESNFGRGWCEDELQPLVRRATGGAVMVLCGGDPETIVRRYRERAERGERHPGHRDGQLVGTVAARLADGIYEPLDLDVPLVRVDTTWNVAGGYVPAYEEIVAAVKGVSREACRNV